MFGGRLCVSIVVTLVAVVLAGCASQVRDAIPYGDAAFRHALTDGFGASSNSIYGDASLGGRQDPGKIIGGVMVSPSSCRNIYLATGYGPFTWGEFAAYQGTTSDGNVSFDSTSSITGSLDFYYVARSFPTSKLAAAYVKDIRNELSSCTQFDAKFDNTSHQVLLSPTTIDVAQPLEVVSWDQEQGSTIILRDGNLIFAISPQDALNPTGPIENQAMITYAAQKLDKALG